MDCVSQYNFNISEFVGFIMLSVWNISMCIWKQCERIIFEIV